MGGNLGQLALESGDCEAMAVNERQDVVIGLAGMAKNTGKTTATQALIDAADAGGLRLGLTSIGYDGEAWDNVTRLPKPRIAVRAGTIVATAESCLKAGSARIGQVSPTLTHNPLGQVVIGVVETDGTVVLAGPHTARELATVNRLIAGLGSRLILVDGAINRIMPMSCSDGVILATGAARCQDISQLASEVAAIARLFAVPTATSIESTAFDSGCLDNGVDSVRLFAGRRLRGTLNGGSLLTGKSALELASSLDDEVDAIVIPGQASADCLQQLVNRLGSRTTGLTIVLTDPLKLLLAGEPLHTARLLDELEAQGSKVATLREVPLLAVTVNPFFPLWRYEHNDYQPAYVDGERLKSAVQAAVRVPVIDVKRDGAEKLLSLIENRFGMSGSEDRTRFGVGQS